MRYFYFFFVIVVPIVFLPNAILIGQPTITGFTPQSGSVGTSVTISGSGFLAGNTNNIVFFGAVKGQITNATTTAITVNVPLGATYKPITVVTGGLSASSEIPFNITFSTAPTFTATSFANKVDFASGNFPRNISIGDLDGDGKSDLASVNNNGNNVSIFRNNSTSGILSLLPPVFIPTNNGPFGENLTDIDGDGKLDMTVNCYSSSSFSIFRNTSSIGNISFASAVTLTANQNNYWIDFADFDSDGKPDLISFNQNSNTYSIFKNTSAVGNISFATRVDFPLGFRPSGGCVGDFDNDGKIDFAVAGIDINVVGVARNTSNGSNITFSAITSYPTATQPFHVTAGDLDGDGKKELIVPNASSTSISIFKNIGNVGTITFAPKLDFSTGSGQPLFGSVNDLDGDGKIDIAVANFNANTVSVFKNQSTLGNISLAPNMQYATGSFCRSAPLGDMDGDGRPDIVTSNSLSNNISILRNTTNPAPCSTADFTFTCQPSRSVNFNSFSSCTITSVWDFGDPSSGSLNTSTSANPSHIFSGAGSYSVTLNSTSSTGTISITKSVTILDASIVIANGITCPNTNTAVLNAVASGSNNPFTFLWDTTPTQTTQTISNIGAGTYTVTVSSANACSASGSITLVNPSPLTINPSITPRKCSTLNGSIVSNVAGGTAPYTYLWNNNLTTQNIIGLDSGLYSLTVKDNNSCTVTLNNILVPYANENISLNLGADVTICPGQKLRLDAGNFLSYLWQDNSTSQYFDVTKTGNYKVAVKDINGCTGVDDINVVVDCTDIYFPTAFTPNGNNINDVFGPAGNNLSIMKAYKLKIYNRYGNLVFYSENPYRKWDGNYNGLKSPNGTFVYNVEYVSNGKQVMKKGYVLLLR